MAIRGARRSLTTEAEHAGLHGIAFDAWGGPVPACAGRAVTRSGALAAAGVVEMLKHQRGAAGRLPRHG